MVIWIPIKRMFKRPLAWQDGKYHGWTLEISMAVGLLFMAIGAAEYVSARWIGSMVVIFGAGIMLGAMFNHRLEQNREKGWGWR